MYLQDSVAIVTGASSGIGASLVSQFVKEGAKHVRILDINEKDGVALQDQLNQRYGTNKVKFTKCDITVDKQFFGAFDEVKNEFGRIDILVNNAGLVKEGNAEEIRKEVEVNLTATINGTVKALELMGKNKGGDGGTVINISSIAGIMRFTPALFAYGATKSAVVHFSNCVGQDVYYSKTGVRVIVICLGATNTPIIGKMTAFDPDLITNVKEIIKVLPMQSAESVARGVVEIFGTAKSGSTWLIQNDAPAKDLTAVMNNYYDSIQSALSDV